VTHWEIIGGNLSKAGSNCGCVSRTDRNGRQSWVVAAERSDAGRFIVHADEMPTAFLELHAAIHRRFEPQMESCVAPCFPECPNQNRPRNREDEN
jgi:hypothetical protein